MTDRNKTRDKLVGSMRQSKDSAASGSGKPKPDNTGHAPARQTAGKTRNTAKPATQRNRHTVSSSQAPRGTDGYQSGGRVWPD
jgi:hypothetical protein